MVDAHDALPLLDKAHELAKRGPFDPFLAWWKQVGEKIANDPAGTLHDFSINIVASIVFALLAWLLFRLWRHLQPSFWKCLAWLGTLKELRALAIHAYQRSVRQRYGQVSTIYLERQEILDLHRIQQC